LAGCRRRHGLWCRDTLHLKVRTAWLDPEARHRRESWPPGTKHPGRVRSTYSLRKQPAWPPSLNEPCATLLASFTPSQITVCLAGVFALPTSFVKLEWKVGQPAYFAIAAPLLPAICARFISAVRHGRLDGLAVVLDRI